MFTAILLMAGNGTRMNKGINKALLPFKGRPLYEHTLELFKKYADEVILVVNKQDNITRDDVIIVNGGATRQESVYNALKAAKYDFVLIHDTARVLLSEDVLKEIIKNIGINNAILTYSLVKNTIKLKANGRLTTLDRAKLISASTPQGAPTKVLLAAHQKALEENTIATDDISLIEKYNNDFKINLVLENEENFKVTTQLDYELLTLLGEKND